MTDKYTHTYTHKHTQTQKSPRAYGLTSLPEKTRKSNHLQMLEQRKHLLLNYFKNPSVGPAGNRNPSLPHDRLAPNQLGAVNNDYGYDTKMLIIMVMSMMMVIGRLRE